MLKTRVRKLAEGITSGHYADGSVDMTPDKSVVWERHDLPDQLGTLLLSPERSADVVNHLARLAIRSDWLPGRIAGGYSKVRLSGDLAIKSFNVNNAIGHYGFEALQANIALGVGLDRVGSILGKWRIVTPRQFDVLYQCNKKEPAVWAMSYEEGRRAVPGNMWRGGFMPPYAERNSLYERALLACGVDHGPVVFDDKPANTLIRRGTITPLEFVKLDLFVDLRAIKSEANKDKSQTDNGSQSFIAA